jgi:ACR3 family arsenite efflux pump ArsB
MKFLMMIKKHLIVSILVSIALGITAGYFWDVSFLSKLILPLTFLLVYPMLVTLNLGSLLEKSNVKLQLSTQIINFIIFPVVAYGLGLLFFKDDAYLRLGLLLIALLPTSGMTISWTIMAKGNINEAVRMVVIGLLMGALLAPIYITFFLGSAISVPMMTIFVQILIIIFIPLLVAFITQKLLIKKFGKEKFHKQIKPKFPLFSTLGIVLIIFVAISLKAKVIVANPLILIEMLIPLLILYAVFFTVSVLSARFLFNRSDGIALVNGTLIRSLSIALAITLSAFPGASLAGLLIAIAYVLQVQIAAWNTKLTGIIFKEQ